jgi:hypothetical protein
MTDTYNKYILNEHNKYITSSFIESTLKKYNINHVVKDINNFKLAFIHISYLKDQQLTDKFIKLLTEINPIDTKLIKKNNSFTR